MKYIHFFKSVNQGFSSPKAVQKLLNLLAVILCVCLFLGGGFYLISRFDDEVSSRKSDLNEEMFHVQKKLFKREALLLHLSRSVTSNVSDSTRAARAEQGAINTQSHDKFVRFNVNMNPLSLRISSRDVSELKTFDAGLIHVSDDQSPTVTRLYAWSNEYAAVPRYVLEKLRSQNNAEMPRFIWLSDPFDPESRVYIFKRISNYLGSGWLGLESSGVALSAMLNAEKVDGYLLLDDGLNRVLSSSGFTESERNIPRPMTLEGFNFAGQGFLPGCLTLNKGVGDSEWTLVYFVSSESILGGIKWSFVSVLTFCCVMGMLICILIRRINSRLVNPALNRYEALIESEAFSRAIIETAPVALCVIRRADGKVVLENRLCAEWFGGQEQHARLCEYWIWRAYEDDLSINEECQTEDGRYLYLSSTLTRYKSEDVLFCAFSDITSHKQVELELVRAKQCADATNDAKNIFLASIGREVRAPIYSVMNALELFGSTNLDSRQTRYLELMRNSAKDLDHQVSNVVELTKLEAGRLKLDLEEFNPCDLVSSIAQEFSIAAKRKGLTLLSFCDPGLPDFVYGDVARIRQIVTNLLSNAINFTDSGRVVLRVRIESRDCERLNLLWQVSDTGCGVPMAQQKHLFDAFYRAQDSGGLPSGTGLGLTISQRLADLMNGYIRLVSEPGLGSSFTLHLPLVANIGVSGESHDFKLQEKPVYIKSNIGEAVENLSGWLRRWGASPHVLKGGELKYSPGVTLVELLPESSHLHSQSLPDNSRVIASLDPLKHPVLEDSVWKVCVHDIQAIGRAIQAAQTGSEITEPIECEQSRNLSKSILMVGEECNDRLVLKEQLEFLGCEVTLACDNKEAIMQWSCGNFDVIMIEVCNVGPDDINIVKELRKLGCKKPIVGVSESLVSEVGGHSMLAEVDLNLIKPFYLSSVFRGLSELK
ncbi:ATP-binding protein [Pseudomonas sp. NPDC087639]|uniref:ATP-binding protein n=1 Tax=Pseudomonas sp. NPDC087639 TaxID=3364445 RepID=UPI0037F467C6